MKGVLLRHLPLPSTQESQLPGFSSRVKRDLAPNSLTRTLTELRDRGAPIVDLTVSNPTSAGLKYPEPQIRELLASGDWTVYEPDPKGRRDARAAVARYYEERGISVDPERIVMTASTSEGYAYLLKLLTEPGDQVLVPRPSYPLFEFLADMELVSLGRYDLHYEDQWWLDLDSVRNACGDATRALIVVHPNNPTGSYLSRRELAGLEDLARERDLAIIGDEVFADYALGEAEPAELLTGSTDSLRFVMNGLSKILALPQMKLGWIVVDGPSRLVEPALSALELISDTYLSVGTPVQASVAGLFALRKEIQSTVGQRLRENLAWLQSAVPSASGCSVLRVGGGWSAVIRVPATRSSEEWATAILRETGVLTHPGRFFDFQAEAYLVVSLLSPHPELVEGIGRMVHFCAAT